MTTTALHLNEETVTFLHKEVTTCRATPQILKVDHLRNYIPPNTQPTTSVFTTSTSLATRDVEVKESVLTFLTLLSSLSQDALDSLSEESEVFTQALGTPVTHLDILFMLWELQKLGIKDKELLRISRKLDRDAAIEHMTKVVENYKGQGEFLLTSSIASAGFGLAAAASIPIGHIWGRDIRDALGGFSLFSALRTMEPDKIGETMMKMFDTMSRTYGETGKMHQATSEGDRTYDEYYKQYWESWFQEYTRKLEESSQDFSRLDNSINEQMRRDYETVVAMYRQ